MYTRYNYYSNCKNISSLYIYIGNTYSHGICSLLDNLESYCETLCHKRIFGF